MEETLFWDACLFIGILYSGLASLFFIIGLPVLMTVRGRGFTRTIVQDIGIVAGLAIRWPDFLFHLMYRDTNRGNGNF